jgi:predicted dehydrogenase
LRVTEPVRFGFLSTAKINTLLLAAARAAEGVDVVAVGSRDRSRAESYAREHGIERAHGSYEELLADTDVDAIYVSLPNSMHVEWTIRALEAGKHVLCEKPFDRRAAEVERAFDAAERADRILMEAFMYRHHPQTKRLAELLAAGVIGELRSVRTSFSFYLDDPENVRLRPELDGGALMDLGCYCVSGTRRLAGEPVRVLGQQLVGKTGVDVRFGALLEFDGDVTAQFECGFDLPQRSGLEALGSEGSLVVASPWECQNPGVEIRRGEESERVEVEDVDRYQVQLDNMAVAIRGDATPLLGRDDAVGQARTIEALYASAAAGTAVDVT